MNIQAEKIELAKLILETDNPSILGLIKSVFDKFNSHDFYNDLTTEQKAEIDLAKIKYHLL
jgi:hypothetical protein